MTSLLFPVQTLTMSMENRLQTGTWTWCFRIYSLVLGLIIQRSDENQEFYVYFNFFASALDKARVGMMITFSLRLSLQRLEETNLLLTTAKLVTHVRKHEKFHGTCLCPFTSADGPILCYAMVVLTRCRRGALLVAAASVGKGRRRRGFQPEEKKPASCFSWMENL